MKTFHPFIEDVDKGELIDLPAVLRRMRDHERTHARDRRREARGKGPVRGGSVHGKHEHHLRREQVVSLALKRLNAEVARRKRIEARASTAEAARKALETRSDAAFRHLPTAEKFANARRMQSLPSRKRRPIVYWARIGSISQVNKRTDATRDNRG